MGCLQRTLLTGYEACACRTIVSRETMSDVVCIVRPVLRPARAMHVPQQGGVSCFRLERFIHGFSLPA